MSTVYRKTAKGQSEIETRAFRLLPRLRQALILVDGRRSDDELAQMIFAEPRATLDALHTGGFIEVARVSDDATPSPDRAPPAQRNAASERTAAPREAAAPASSPEVVRRDAVRFLNDQLGPAAEGIAMKLERAKTMAELQPLLATAAQLIGALRGAGAAQTFSARFLAEQPA